MDTDTKQLKSLLHESIENIDDTDLLRIAKSILDRKYAPDENIQLNEYQKQRLDEAKRNIKAGKFLTNDQADEIVAKWLNE